MSTPLSLPSFAAADHRRPASPCHYGDSDRHNPTVFNGHNLSPVDGRPMLPSEPLLPAQPPAERSVTQGAPYIQQEHNQLLQEAEKTIGHLRQQLLAERALAVLLKKQGCAEQENDQIVIKVEPPPDFKPVTVFPAAPELCGEELQRYREMAIRALTGYQKEQPVKAEQEELENKIKNYRERFEALHNRLYNGEQRVNSGLKQFEELLHRPCTLRLREDEQGKVTIESTANHHRQQVPQGSRSGKPHSTQESDREEEPHRTQESGREEQTHRTQDPQHTESPLPQKASDNSRDHTIVPANVKETVYRERTEIATPDSLAAPGRVMAEPLHVVPGTPVCTTAAQDEYHRQLASQATNARGFAVQQSHNAADNIVLTLCKPGAGQGRSGTAFVDVQEHLIEHNGCSWFEPRLSVVLPQAEHYITHRAEADTGAFLTQVEQAASNAILVAQEYNRYCRSKREGQPRLRPMPVINTNIFAVEQGAKIGVTAAQLAAAIRTGMARAVREIGGRREAVLIREIVYCDGEEQLFAQAGAGRGLC